MDEKVPKCTRIIVMGVFADGFSTVTDIPEPAAFRTDVRAVEPVEISSELSADSVVAPVNHEFTLKVILNDRQPAMTSMVPKEIAEKEGASSSGIVRHEMTEVPSDRPVIGQADALLEVAWGLIANAGWDAGSGDVSLQKTEGWHEAAVRWRDEYFEYSGREEIIPSG